MHKELKLNEAFNRLFSEVSLLRESLEDERNTITELSEECSTKITVHKEYLLELLNKRKETVIRLLNGHNESLESLKPYRPQ